MEFVNGKDDIPYIVEKSNSCSKPPTRYYLVVMLVVSDVSR